MSEALNLRVDENDNPQGGATRNEIHQNGYWHRIVAVWLVNPDDEMILQKRLASKKLDPGKLDSSASGHVDFDDWNPEDDSTAYENAGRREVAEELGVENIEGLHEIARWNIEESNTLGGEVIRRFFKVYLGRTDKKATELHVKRDELDGVIEIPMDDFAAMVDFDDSRLVEGVKTAFNLWRSNESASYRDFYGDQ